MVKTVNNIRGFLRIFAFVMITLILIPLQILCVAILDRKHHFTVPRIWHYFVSKIFGIRIYIKGTLIRDKQVVFVSNHISYFDIITLGATLSNTCFVSKDDVKNWPVFGILAKLQHTIFINRSRHAAEKEGLNVTDRLNNNDESIVLFPEGTSSNGSDVLPFKSSLFSLFYQGQLQKQLSIQPVSIFIETVNNQKHPDITQEYRDAYTWYGDMDLAPHLWAFAKSYSAHISITFHAPLDIDNFENRKVLAKHCFEAVRSPFQEEWTSLSKRHKNNSQETIAA